MTEKAECRGDLIQGRLDENGVASTDDTQSFNVIVWPEREPTSQGTLIDLDSHDLTVPIEVEANVDITVRTSEMATPTGFMWEKPVKEWECVTLEDDDFETFVTGFNQMLFKSMDKDVDCEEEVTLVRTDGSGEDTLIVKVLRGHCPVVECDDTDILDIDVKSCECKPLQETKGEVFDSRSMTVATRQVRLNKLEHFTIREWATTDGAFEWTAFDADTLNCVALNEIWEDQYGRYRHVVFVAEMDDCKGDLTQAMVTDEA